MKIDGFMTSEIPRQTQKPFYAPPIALSPRKESNMESEMKLIFDDVPSNNVTMLEAQSQIPPQHLKT